MHPCLSGVQILLLEQLTIIQPDCTQSSAVDAAAIKAVGMRCKTVTHLCPVTKDEDFIEFQYLRKGEPRFDGRWCCLWGPRVLQVSVLRRTAAANTCQDSRDLSCSQTFPARPGNRRRLELVEERCRILLQLILRCPRKPGSGREAPRRQYSGMQQDVAARIVNQGASSQPIDQLIPFRSQQNVIERIRSLLVGETQVEPDQVKIVISENGSHLSVVLVKPVQGFEIPWPTVHYVTYEPQEVGLRIEVDLSQ